MGGQAELLAHAPLEVHGLRLQAVVFGDVAAGRSRGRRVVSGRPRRTRPFPRPVVPVLSGPRSRGVEAARPDLLGSQFPSLRLGSATQPVHAAARPRKGSLAAIRRRTHAARWRGKRRKVGGARWGRIRIREPGLTWLHKKNVFLHSRAHGAQAPTGWEEGPRRALAPTWRCRSGTPRWPGSRW